MTYNEASVDYGLDSEGDDDVMYYNEKATPLSKSQKHYYDLTAADNGAAADEIDLVLAHSRDEEHASDPKDSPQTNLVSMHTSERHPDLQRFHIKWKGYSHIHNTDEMYHFLKGYKG